MMEPNTLFWKLGACLLQECLPCLTLQLQRDLQGNTCSKYHPLLQVRGRSQQSPVMSFSGSPSARKSSHPQSANSPCPLEGLGYGALNDIKLVTRFHPVKTHWKIFLGWFIIEIHMAGKGQGNCRKQRKPLSLQHSAGRMPTAATAVGGQGCPDVGQMGSCKKARPPPKN